MNKRNIALLFRRLSAFVLFCCAGFMTGVSAQSPEGYSPQKTSFTVQVKDLEIQHQIFSLFVLPGVKLDFRLLNATSPKVRFSDHNAQQLVSESGKWSWTAPQKKGLYRISIKPLAHADSMHINVFVMIPNAMLKGEVLNNYRIGRYPSTPLKQLDIYKPPAGFIEVTPENESTYLTPHFQLKQFLCKQAGGYPKYVVLREQLLQKLEVILEQVNEKGIVCRTFHVMSGYRTPYYNKAIGNVKYSRHTWGDAADIFVDENPQDGVMDDLNNDGVINYRDADVLYEIIEGLYHQPWYQKFIGGLGLYKKNANHGPFVHVDARGYRARWGKK